MSKIGLKIGENTGLNLNILIQNRDDTKDTFYKSKKSRKNNKKCDVSTHSNVSNNRRKTKQRAKSDISNCSNL